jgi:hypothetical protein
LLGNRVTVLLHNCGIALLIEQVRDPDRRMICFSIYLIIPAELGPGIHSASNRNENQKEKHFSGK